MTRLTRLIRLASMAHLARRFFGSLSRAEPPADDLAWVRSTLSAEELGLWSAMAVQDRRHSIEVARRFVVALPGASRAEIAAALLHDVGKCAARLGTFGRVVATVVGPRLPRFQRYHDHERIGADMVRGIGGDAVTVALIARTLDAPQAAAGALAMADHV